MQTPYNTHTMADGLRVIHLPSTSPVVYCGYAIDAGTRDETDEEEGLAHLIEHLSFKGTTTRKPLNILRTIESVGGDLNAFTTKEDTVYHAAVLKDHAKRAIELLNDIVFHSVYPQTELEKEVNVVIEEIESYNDSPSELIYDEFENILFCGHPLGHNILGKAERLLSYRSEDLQRFANKHYRADKAVFFLYGDVNFSWLIKVLETLGHNRVQSDIEPLLQSKNMRKSPLPPFCGGKKVLKHDTHQAHVMIGNRAYCYDDDRKTTLYLLNNILAGPALTSLLNISLRERNALVYTVEGSFSTYSDTGAWSIYFGCDNKNVEKCLQIIHHELNKICQQSLSLPQLAKAKKQIKGQIAIANDSHESFTLDSAKTFLHYGKPKDITQMMADIDGVTTEMIQQVAQDIFQQERLFTLIMK